MTATQQQDNDTIRLSDLEERLISDRDGRFRDQLTADLFEQLTKLKTVRDQALAPAEFATVEALILAIAAAGETVAKTWQKYHKPSQSVKS